MARTQQARRRRNGGEITSALSAVTSEIGKGRKIGEACRRAGVSVPSYYRWRAQARSDDGGSKADAKREAILRAAKSVFLREGYNANLASVAAAAGVARQTVYNQFGTKERLFHDVVQSVYQNLMRPVLEVERNGDFISRLTSYGRYFMKIAFDPDSLALLRITLGEYRSSPELAKLSYALRASHATPVFTDHVADYLEAQMKAGVIERCDPLLAAETFFGSFTAHARHRALIGIGYDTPERLEAMLALSVKVFARGLGYRGMVEAGQGTV